MNPPYGRPLEGIWAGISWIIYIWSIEGRLKWRGSMVSEKQKTAGRRVSNFVQKDCPRLRMLWLFK